jgi:hypothetical protein
MWRLRIFGIQVASLERDDDEPPPDGITGGSMMCFDRDTEPLDPTPGEEWYDEDRRIGFR